MTPQPKKVKAPDTCEDYLTPGKEYDVIKAHNISDKYWNIELTADDGGNVYSQLKGTSHLKGGDWIVTETETA